MNSGLKLIMDKATYNYEKLPMLDIIFDRLSRAFTASLRNLTTENVDVEVAKNEFMRFSSYTSQIPSPIAINIFKAIEFDNYGMLIMNDHLVYNLLDILLGGKKNLTVFKASENRIYTDIELALIKDIVTTLLSDFHEAFEPITDVSFLLDRVETNPAFASIARPGDTVISVTMNVLISKREGKIDIVIPYSMIEPVKDQLTQVFIGDHSANDAEWEKDVEDIALNLDFDISAIIIDHNVSFGDLVLMKVGSTLVLDQKISDDVILCVNGVKTWKGSLGKVEEKLAICITENLIKKTDEK